jgi:hypothetical protein
MQRYRPDWVSLLEARQHLVVTGVALHDAESDITLAIRDRKIRVAAPQNKITITTYLGVIVDPLSPAILSLKRQAQWRPSCPENLSPGDLDFENSGSRKPWLYPGFHGHISSGLRLWFNYVGCSDWMRPTPPLKPPFDLASPLVRRQSGRNRQLPRLIGRTRCQRMLDRTQKVM